MRVSTIDIETRPLYFWDDERLHSIQRNRLLKRAFRSLTGQDDWMELRKDMLDILLPEQINEDNCSDILKGLKKQLGYSDELSIEFCKKWIEKAEGYMSTDAMLCDIVCIGETVMGSDINTHTKLYVYDEDVYDAYFSERDDNNSLWHTERTWDECSFGAKKHILEELRESLIESDKVFGWMIRRFDSPILMNRMAEAGLRVPNLVPNRYNLSWMVDLYEVVSAFGNSPSYINFDSLCERIDISSPKRKGIDGSKVLQAYKDGRYLDICKYVCIDSRQEAKAARAIYKQYRNLIK